MNQDKAVVVNTGSLYSIILLAKVVAEKGAENVTSIYFNGEFNDNIMAIVAVEEELQVETHIIPLGPFLYPDDADLPFRNGVYAALAASIAVKIGAGIVYMATWNNEEYDYPDATMDFTLPLSAAVIAGTGGDVSLVFPFQRNSTTELILMAERLQAPIEFSYSCIHWSDSDTHCGECKGCTKRIQAFKDAGIIDPAEYEITIVWGNCKPFGEPENDDAQKCRN